MNVYKYALYTLLVGSLLMVLYGIFLSADSNKSTMTIFDTNTSEAQSTLYSGDRRKVTSIFASLLDKPYRDAQTISTIWNGTDVNILECKEERPALLEVIDTKGYFLPEGHIVRTTANPNPFIPDNYVSIEPIPGEIYESITNGRDLDRQQVTLSVEEVTMRSLVTFIFLGQSVDRVASFTATNISQPMCIVIDNIVLGCPVIQGSLLDGKFEIAVDIQEDAERMLNQLKYGSLQACQGDSQMHKWYKVRVDDKEGWIDARALFIDE
jgi:hypothetical protein